MPAHTIVGFVADFPIESNGPSPAGRELSVFLVEQLKESGFEVDGPHDHQEWAWSIYSTEDQLRMWSLVGLVDDMESTPPRQWLMTNQCGCGFLKSLIGGKAFRESLERYRRRFCETLHKIMSSDARFSDIVWYNEKTFDKPADEPRDRP